MQFSKQRDSPNWFWKLSSSHATYLTKTEGLILFFSLSFIFFLAENRKSKSQTLVCVVDFVNNRVASRDLPLASHIFLCFHTGTGQLHSWLTYFLARYIRSFPPKNRLSRSTKLCWSKRAKDRDRSRLLCWSRSILALVTMHGLFTRTGSEYDEKPWIPDATTAPVA